VEEVAVWLDAVQGIGDSTEVAEFDGVDGVTGCVVVDTGLWIGRSGIAPALEISLLRSCWRRRTSLGRFGWSGPMAAEREVRGCSVGSKRCLLQCILASE